MRQEGMKRLLSSPAGVLLKESRAVEHEGEKLSLKVRKQRMARDLP